MEKSDLLKLLVVFIAVIFVLSMFSQFGKGNKSGTTTENLTSTTIGVGSARCRIVAFSNEMTVDPWTNETAVIAESLKAQKKIDYMNLIGKKGILILPGGGNISEVRFSFANSGSSTTADASCSVTGLVNFTLQNGTVQEQAPGSVRLSLDPFSRVGDELNLDLTVDIRETGITNMKATTVPDIGEGATIASFECSDNYKVSGAVNWSKRNLNISLIASELNVSENAISYKKNDTIGFTRQLTEEEVAQLNTSDLKDVTDENTIRAFTDKFGNMTPVFYPSYITIVSNGDESFNKTVDFISSIGTVTMKQRGCTLSIPNTMEVNAKQMLVSSNARQMNYYMDTVEVLNGTGNVNIFGNASYVGRVVTAFDLIGTK